MFAMKLRIVATLLSAPVPTPGHHAMTYRASENVYALLGEGTFRTKDCTYTPRGQEVVISRPNARGQVWATFLDDDGQEEAQCELALSHTQVPTVERRPIWHGIATTER